MPDRNTWTYFLRFFLMYFFERSLHTVAHFDLSVLGERNSNGVKHMRWNLPDVCRMNFYGDL